MPVHIEKDGPITVITLDRAHAKNAVDRPTADALSKAFADFERDGDARVAILTGANQTFCAGADLKAAARGDAVRIEPDGDAPLGPSRRTFSKPVIAAIAGYAVAGGFELACLCDLRVVEEDAVLGVFCRRWGVPLIDGGTVRLPRLIGLSRALDLILTGRPVDAKEAFALGLANRVTKKGEALAEAKRIAQTLAAFPQECVRTDRQSAIEGLELPFGEAMKNEWELGMRALAHAGEGIQRFADGAGRHGGFDE